MKPRWEFDDSCAPEGFHGGQNHTESEAHAALLIAIVAVAFISLTVFAIVGVLS